RFGPKEKSVNRSSRARRRRSAGGIVRVSKAKGKSCRVPAGHQVQPFWNIAARHVAVFSRRSPADVTTDETSIPCPSPIISRSSQPNLCVHTSHTPVTVVSPLVLVRQKPSGNRSGVPFQLARWVGVGELLYRGTRGMLGLWVSAGVEV